jgi:sodium transport system ATP-binding protein
MIRVENLSKSFKKLTAVDNISFSVKEGEILGLVGENGAGKTTTLRMLATMLEPSKGKITINSFSVDKDAQKIRGEVGILFGGEVGLYDRLSARENMQYFAELNGMSKELVKERINYLAKKLEMEEYLDRRVGKFSRGMKQKVAIGRSIVHNPSVMLFDEPTAGLDVSAARIVQDFIEECKNDNKAIVFSSHSMSEVEKLCDRIVIIHKGKIIENCTVKELKTKHNNEDVEEIFMTLVGDKNEK